MTDDLVTTMIPGPQGTRLQVTGLSIRAIRKSLEDADPDGIMIFTEHTSAGLLVSPVRGLVFATSDNPAPAYVTALGPTSVKYAVAQKTLTIVESVQLFPNGDSVTMDSDLNRKWFDVINELTPLGWFISATYERDGISYFKVETNDTAAGFRVYGVKQDGL